MHYSTTSASYAQVADVIHTVPLQMLSCIQHSMGYQSKGINEVFAQGRYANIAQVTLPYLPFKFEDLRFFFA